MGSVNRRDAVTPGFLRSSWRSGALAVKIYFIMFLFIGISSAFAQTPVSKPAWLEYKNPYAGEEDLISNPHRSAEEITTWAQQIAAEVLSFGPADYKKKLGGFKKYFVTDGWQTYAAFMKKAQLISRVEEGGYSLVSIVNAPPEITQQGDSGGVYHWTVKMSVTISVFGAGRDGKNRLETSGKYILLLDMARVAEGGDNGIAINRWHVDGVS